MLRWPGMARDHGDGIGWDNKTCDSLSHDMSKPFKENIITQYRKTTKKIKMAIVMN